MTFDEQQHDFYKAFEGCEKVKNFYINSDHLEDLVPVYRSLKRASHAEHTMEILPTVRTYQQIKESRRVAKLKGVTTDDIH